MTDLVKIQREGQGDRNIIIGISFIGLVNSNYTSKTDLENVVTY